MKTLALILLTALTATAAEPKKPAAPVKPTPAKPAVPEKPPWIALDARSGARGRLNSYNWKSSWGSFDRDVTRWVTIDATLTNRTQKPVEATLVWAVVVKEVAGEFPLEFIIGGGVKTIPLGPGQAKVIRTDETEVVANDLVLKALGERWGDGVKITGWLAQAKYGEQVLASRCSADSLKQMAAQLDLQAVVERRNKAMADGTLTPQSVWDEMINGKKEP